MAKTRCSSIADPFPEETLYSWLCRIGLLSQSGSDKEFLEQFMGYRGEQLTSIFPAYLTHLSKYSGINAQELLNQHSTLPYFRPFIRSEVYSQTVEALVSTANSDGFAKFSLLANRVPEQKRLFYCPDCAMTDLQKVGVVYWHREHQLPWVNICSLHSSRLVGIARKRKTFVLPPQTSKRTPKTEKTKLVEERIHTLAVESTRLLYSNHAELDPERVKATYLHALKIKGLLTLEGSVKQIIWRQMLEQLWCDLIPKKVYSALFGNKKFRPFPTNLIYQPEAQHHPIKHLVVILHLFGSLERFLDAYRNLELPLPESRIPTTEANEITCKKVSILLSRLRSGDSLRQAAKAAKVSVGFAKSTALKNGIEIERRAQRLFAAERKQIKDMLKAGTKTQEIAHTMKCSVGAVEQILAQFPEIRRLRERLRFYQKRHCNRQRITTYLKKNSGATRGAVKNNESAAYYWCYKHDNKWLYRSLPNEIPRTERYKKKC
jgi:hypothetical protein